MQVMEEGGGGTLAKTSAAVFYGLSSIAVVFTNKVLLTNYRFPSFILLAVIQMATTVAALWMARLLRLVSFPKFDKSIPRRIFPLPIFFLLNLVAGLGGTQKMSLPMFTVLRRFSILMTMLLEYRILGVEPTRAVKYSVFLMIFGSVVAAAYDLTFDWYGYTLVFINNCATAANGVYIKKMFEAKLSSILFPGSIQLRLVKWNAQSEAEKRENWRLLQQDWDKRGINKPVPVDRIIKGKYQDNFEFLQWVKRLFDANFDGHACSPVKMRDGVELPASDKFRANRQRFPSMQLRRESLAPSTFNSRPSVGFSSVQRPNVVTCGTPAPRQSLGFVPTSASINRGAVMQISLDGKSASSQLPPYRTPQKPMRMAAPAPSFNASLNQLAKEMDKIKEERDYYVRMCYVIEQYCRENVGRVGVAANVLEELGKWGFLFYNSVFMLPPAVVLLLATDDVQKVQDYAQSGAVTHIVVVLVGLSCTCAFLLNYSMALCLQKNSALTTTCIGPIKNLIVTYAGMVSSGDYVFQWLNFIGVNISVFGSVLYTYVTFRQPAVKQSAQSKKRGRVRARDVGRHITVEPVEGKPLLVV